MKLRFQWLTFVFLAAALCGVANAASVKVMLSGLASGDRAVLTLSSETYMASENAESDGTYTFGDVPEGLHSVKVEVSGYNLPDTKLVRVNADGSVDPAVGIQLAITKMDEDPDKWVHVWESDGSIGGYTTTSYVNTRPEVEFLGKKIVPSDVPSMALLYQDYKILLADDEDIWTSEYAYRLLETLKTIPALRNTMAKFTLTSDHLEDDITVTDFGDGLDVRISADAFYYANPFLVNLDGVRGRFFSKRLHHALVKYVTDFGKDLGVVNHILHERFGCGTDVPDIEALTGEHSSEFQNFYPSELVAIINMLEELPEGYHATPNLKYLVRRTDGHTHPIYKEAAAIAWCSEEGYIEFINAPHVGVSAFGGNNEQFGTQRLILHEKTHFLWAFSFPEEIKNDWIELGGWYRDPNAGDDPDAGWSTTQTVEFVSQYAHDVNPNEDMAESVAYYLKDPELLRSRALPKYEFIRDRIMHGTRYISTIPDYLTFEVLNLNPDYDYPGKIKKVEVQVNGAPEEDKTIVFDLYLNHIEGFDDGASGAYTRIMSPKFIDDDGNENGTYIDFGFAQVNGDPWHLRGESKISKYSKAGYWVPGSISVSDQVGNARYEGRNDCISNIYINNPLEDLIAPKYEKGSLRYEVKDIMRGGRHEQCLSVKFRGYDNLGLTGVYGGMYTGVDSNHMPGWNTIVDAEEKTIEIQYLIRDYFYEADYYLAHIGLTDVAGLGKDVRFDEDPNHEPVQKIHIKTPNPDYENVEIDLNRIYVYAEPTHPEAPDGETKVDISFYARDNISGICSYGVTLRDPQGKMFTYGGGDGIPYDEYGYFDGDPTAWRKYGMTIILPQGSAPGIWGVAEMNVRDLAFNDFTYNFVETMIFEPDDSEDGWVLFADIEDSNLYFTLNSSEGGGFGYTWRVIHEETGREISGEYKYTGLRSAGQVNVDLSGMPEGELIIIVTAKDASGEVSAVKSCKISYEGEKEEYVAGDSNGNGTVNIADAVNTANYAVGKDVEYICLEAADVNGDGGITLADASGTVSIILSQDVPSGDDFMRKAASRSDENADCLRIEDHSMVADDPVNVKVYLDNTVEYVGLQADVRIPEGMVLEEIVKGNRSEYTHSLASKEVGERITRVVLFNFESEPFTPGGDSLFELVVRADGDPQGNIRLTGIVASDALGNEFTLASVMDESESSVGIQDGGSVKVYSEHNALMIVNACGQDVRVYSADGSAVARFTASAPAERVETVPGIYIVSVGDRSFKTMVK